MRRFRRTGLRQSGLRQSVEEARKLVAIAGAPAIAGGGLAAVRFGRDDRQDAAPKQVFARAMGRLSDRAPRAAAIR